MAYIDTPRSEADATSMTNGHHLENFSIENSFASPLKRKEDLAIRKRTGRGLGLKTPRVPFSDRRNLPAIPGRGEFTPLLQSVAKKNLEHNSRINSGPETPAFLKPSYNGSNTPALPGAEASALYGSELESSVLRENEGTPVPQVTSSSAQSTPLAALPNRDAAGVLNDQGNVMTLREQENIISKIDKENFGLKLKIHFLEESLRKAGPGFNEAALRENTDLKVDKVTIQRELARCRKDLTQAERDVESYKRHVQDKRADESLRQELKTTKDELIVKTSEVEVLRAELSTTESQQEDAQKLKEEIEDLEADLREKDRLLDERDEEIEKVKSQEKKDADEFEQVCNELEVAKERIEDLENEQRDNIQNDQKLAEVRAELDDALRAKSRVEEDLDEIREEISNKSFTTKGLSRQLEDKANKFQTDLNALREKYVELDAKHDDRSREVKKLEDQLHEREQDADVRDQRLKDQNELLQHERETIARKCDSLAAQAQQTARDLETKSDEKDLLHSRHDALTAESQNLQKDLSKSQNRTQQLEQDLEDERQHAEENDRRLRSEAKTEIDRLSKEIDDIHRDYEDQENKFAAEKNQWESHRRSLQTQKEKAEEQANGLQRTINKLQEVEGTLSGQEFKLKEALESEKQRHRKEESLLARQVHDLGAELDERHKDLDTLRSEFSQTRENLRAIQREKAGLEDKVQALEDEIDVLQSSLDDEVEKAKDIINALEQDIEPLKSELADARHRLSGAQNDIQERGGKEEIMKLQERISDVSASRDRDLGTATRQIQRLEAQVEELQRRQTSDTDRRGAAELSVVQKELGDARKKETGYLEREADQRAIIRDLKQQISQLERQVHELEVARLAIDSPKSSVDSSEWKNEVLELQRQLTDAHQQTKDSRHKSKEDIRALQRRLAESERLVQTNLDTYEQQREQLEAELTSIQQEQESLLAKNEIASQTINRLRTRISSLEKDIRGQRHAAVADNTIAEERKDLHELLKDAKLTAEDLQVQITARENQLSASSTREKDLRTQLRRVREERTLQTQKCSVLSTELDHLQTRYENAVDNLSRQQRKWEDERKAMASKVRFANTSLSELHQDQSQTTELVRKHASELKGLAKQIQWLRAKCAREQGFRSSLVYEKRFLLMQIEMFETCNAIDLNLLSEMGINTNNTPSLRLRLGDTLRSKVGKNERKRPSLRAVGLAILASGRMRRMSQEWAGQKRVREALGKRLEGLVEGRKGKGRRVSGGR